MDDLHTKLKQYKEALHSTPFLKDLKDDNIRNCTETLASLDELSQVSSNLTKYQKCSSSLCTDKLHQKLHEVTVLNNDLLQNLGSPKASPSPSSLPETYDNLQKCIQCVDCWLKQVKKIYKPTE